MLEGGAASTSVHGPKPRAMVFLRTRVHAAFNPRGPSPVGAKISRVSDALPESISDSSVFFDLVGDDAT